MDYILQETKGIKDSFANGAKAVLDKYSKLPIFNVKGTSEWAEISVSTEGFSGTKETSELGTPDINSLGEGYEVQMVTKRFTNAYLISSTARRKMLDNSTKVREYLTEQRNGLLYDINYKFITELHEFLNTAFVTTNYAAPDAKALIADDHAWNSGETFDNMGTELLDAAAVDSAVEAGVAIQDGTGKHMGVSYNAIVVRTGSANARMAKKLFAEGISPTAIGDINIYHGEYTIYETPYLTSANYWFMMDTKKGVSPLYVGVNQAPHYTTPKEQDNESIRQNIEGFWMQGIKNMPYFVYGSNGTT